MSEIIKEYKRYIVTFYLHKRRKPKYFHSDPVLKWYRWYIAYFRITSDEILEKVWRIHYSSKGFRKNVVNDGDTNLVLPAHDPKYYVEFARELDTEITYIKREVELPNKEKVVVDVPVIVFNSDSQGHLHMLFSAVLSTYTNPSGVWRKVARLILDHGLWCDMLGVTVFDRFVKYREFDYMNKGVHYVKQIGLAFRAMYGLL
ncbi:MAG: hypothetical protein QW607_06480 [Desulfurococcaceae archaeon]